MVNKTSARTFLLFLGLALLLANAVEAHKLVLLPRKDATTGQRSLLPVAVPGQHLAVTPTAVNFGGLTIGQSASRTVTVTNVTSNQTLTIATSGTGNGLSASPASLTLAPGASATVTLTYAPTRKETLSGAVTLLSYHQGITAPVRDPVSVQGQALNGPQLKIFVGLLEVSSTNPTADFGTVTRRSYSLDDAPSFTLLLQNVGDLPANNVRFGPLGLNWTGLAECVQVLSESDVCRSTLDDSTPVATTIPASGIYTTVWRFFPGDVGPFTRVFEILGDNLATVPFTITGEAVPFLHERPVLPAAASTSEISGLKAISAAVETEPVPVGNGAGRNIDPFANDPLGIFRPTGFDPKSLFQVGNLDNVDIQSGNLVLALPIGEQVTARGGLSFQLQAVYNSNIWARTTMFDTDTVAWDGPNPRANNPSNRFPRTSNEFPDPVFNTGMGWSLHLGRLLPPMDWNAFARMTWQDQEKVVDTGPYYTYISPNGTRYQFSWDPNLPRVPAVVGGPEYESSTYLYERRGSYMRLTRISATERHVELPGGEIHVFEKTSEVSHPDEWTLREIRDRFGNRIEIVYEDTAWKLHFWYASGSEEPDDDRRTVTVNFTTTDGTHNYPLLVQSVNFEGFEGGAARSYTFDYTRLAAQDRPPTSVWHTHNAPLLGDTTLDVVLMSGVTLPDGTKYSFTYNGPTSDPALRRHLLTQAALPTGGTLEWEYGIVQGNPPACAATDVPSNMINQGVVVRRALDLGGQALTETRYLRKLRDSEVIPDNFCQAFHNQGGGKPKADLAVGVWKLEQDKATGDGDATSHDDDLTSLEMHYFSVWPYGIDCPSWLEGEGCAADSKTATGWTYREKSLNMTRAETLGDLFLSRRLYSCGFDFDHIPAGADPGDPALLTRDPENLLSQCSLEQSVWTRYEIPRPDRCEVSSRACNIGARVVASRTVEETDGGEYIETRSSDYDGLGHYRTTVLSGTYRGTAASTLKTTFQNYNSGAGTLSLGEDGHLAPGTQSITLPDTWILETFTDRSVTEGGTTYAGRSCFDATTGVMTAQRTFAGFEIGVKDLLTTFKYNANGELELERHFGADTYTGGLPLDDTWCTDPDWGATNAGKKDYLVRYEHEHGLLARKHVDGTTVYETWRTLDPATGWIKSEVASSGEKRTFTYDAMGRIEAIDAEHSADLDFAYAQPTASTGWAVTATQRENKAQNPGVLSEYRADFDGMGRVVGERFLHPDGTRKRQETTYHPSGALASRTVIHNGGVTNPNTTAAVYDVRGRILRATLPDTKTLDWQYTGTRVNRQIADVEGPAGSIRSAVRRFLDEQGRLTRIDVGTLSESSALTTTYSTTLSYDPAGKLTSAIRSGGGRSQSRSWTRDGRGFLLSESIPERIATGGTPQSLRTKRHFETFNTRGQALRVRDKEGTTIRRTQNWTFDDLGRPDLLRVDSQTLKDWTYFPSCSTGQTFDLDSCAGTNGQLQTAVRFAYRSKADSGGLLCQDLPNATCVRDDFEVTSTYGYDAAGRTSSKKTKVEQTTEYLFTPVGEPQVSGAFIQSWTYDDLGNLASVTYPCIPQGGDLSKACPVAPRTVDYSYTNGLLTAVTEPGLGATLAYHPNASLHTITHGNTKVDTFGTDSSGMPRVGSINLASGGLNLGAFSYDSAGNITGIGAETFRYDEASRLVSATVRKTTAGATQSFTYAYDIFDNRTDWGTVDDTTNHLTGVSYDRFGNLIGTGAGFAAAYDRLEKIETLFDNPTSQTACSPSNPCTLSIYDHDDLRILSYRPGPGYRWTVRDLGGRVLSDFIGSGAGGNGNLTHTKDYVYAGDKLLSSSGPAGVQHYHLDHLGSTRVITNASGGVVSRKFYEPFGVKIGTHNDTEPIDFTGHERELDGVSMYMRGRQYLVAADGNGTAAGRFLQVDPGRDGAAWSLYAYAANNPIRRIDFTGRQTEEARGDEVKEKVKDLGRDAAITGGGLAGTIGEKIFEDQAKHVERLGRVYKLPKRRLLRQPTGKAIFSGIRQGSKRIAAKRLALKAAAKVAFRAGLATSGVGVALLVLDANDLINLKREQLAADIAELASQNAHSMEKSPVQQMFEERERQRQLEEANENDEEDDDDDEPDPR